MKHYAQFNSLGEIQSTYTLQDEIDPSLCITGHFIEVPLQVSPNNSWVNDGALVDYTPDGAARKAQRPAYQCHWVPALEAWVDDRTLAEVKDSAWERIKAKRGEAEFGGFSWDGSAFDSDPTSQQRIQGAAQMAQIAMASGHPFSIEWTLRDNTTRMLSGEEMIQVGLDMGQHINACHAKARQLRQQIEAATTKEELEAIVW